MWNYYSPRRRKSSTSSHPQMSPTSPTSPTAPVSPTSGAPYFSSALVESPELSAAQHFGSPTQEFTPSQLGRVDGDPSLTGQSANGSAGSRAPLLTRDFASRPLVDTIPERGTERESPATRRGAAESSESFNMVSDIEKPDRQPIQLQAPPPPRLTSHKSSGPRIIPPPSVHDEYVSHFISPLSIESGPSNASGSTDNRHPMMIRTSSAPGDNAQPRQLLPSPLLARPVERDQKVLKDGTPIYDIFNAALEENGEGMVRALKGHLEQVLKVQEEIGRMHLALERLSVGDGSGWEKWDEHQSPETKLREDSGTVSDGSAKKGKTGGKGGAGRSSASEANTAKNDADGKEQAEQAERALVEREKGVEEIMQRLGTLSDRLRTYHTLGTPRLSFPQPTNLPSPAHEPLTPLTGSSAFAMPSSPMDPPRPGSTPPKVLTTALRSPAHHLPPSPLHQMHNRSDSAYQRSALSKSVTTVDETDMERAVESPGVLHPDDQYRLQRFAEPETYGSDLEGRSPTKSSGGSPLSPTLGMNTERSVAGWAARSGEKERETGQQKWVENKYQVPEVVRHGVGGKKSVLDGSWDAVDRSRPW